MSSRNKKLNYPTVLRSCLISSLVAVFSVSTMSLAVAETLEFPGYYSVSLYDDHTIMWPKESLYGFDEELSEEGLAELDTCQNAASCSPEAIAAGVSYFKVQYIPGYGRVYAYYNETGQFIASQKISDDSNALDAFRFLTRATFGATNAAMNEYLDVGYDAWLEDQFAQQPSYQYPLFKRAKDEAGYDFFSNTRPRQLLRLDAWWGSAINGQDQLRQRVAFALSQIFVVSDQDASVRPNVGGVAKYNDVLIEHALGNFGDLLKAVTLNPMMGNYLSMKSNRRANSSGTIQPDENYAREVMQLFTIGLVMLNNDGTAKLNAGQETIPTYDQDDIRNLARVFTGWDYWPDNNSYDKNGKLRGPYTRSAKNTIRRMEQRLNGNNIEFRHDKDEKTLLHTYAGTVSIPAEQAAEDELDIALGQLFNHPNTGPFIGKQLIQRLVTSNPSTGYVGRVALKFNDNGDGVRGDLKAVVKAILTDQEAFNGHIDAPETFGKLKEPLLRVAQLWRAYQAKGIKNRLRFANSNENIKQRAFSAPSVFNFYSPSYSEQGDITLAGLVSPEFQILNESSSITTNNLLRQLAFQYGSTGGLSDFHRIHLNLERAESLANDGERLTDYFNQMLLGGRMSSGMKSVLINFMSSVPLNEERRVKELLFLVITSPEYAYQR